MPRSNLSGRELHRVIEARMRFIGKMRYEAQLSGSLVNKGHVEPEERKAWRATTLEYVRLAASVHGITTYESGFPVHCALPQDEELPPSQWEEMESPYMKLKEE